MWRCLPPDSRRRLPLKTDRLKNEKSPALGEGWARRFSSNAAPAGLVGSVTESAENTLCRELCAGPNGRREVASEVG
jgi:hypothetical protein